MLELLPAKWAQICKQSTWEVNCEKSEGIFSDGRLASVVKVLLKKHRLG